MIFIMGVEVQHIGWWLSGGGIVAMLVTPLWMMAKTRITKKAMYASAIVIEMSAYVAIFLFAGPGTGLLLVLFILFLGIGDAACQLAPNSMVADTVEVDELATGERREGTIYGAISFCLKLGMAGGAFLSSIVLDIFGFVPGTGLAAQSEFALTGIRIAYCLLPVLLWVCAFVILRRYSLTEARFEEIQQRLRSRAALE
jgi:GPH family glycoside/pentoside/hexuronide:cation symporter